MQHNLRYLSLFLLACIPWPLCGQTQPRQPGEHAKAPGAASTSTSSSKPRLATVKNTGEDANGLLDDGNVYKNALLDLTLALPGEWQFLDDESRDQAEGRAVNKQNASRQNASGQNPETSTCKGPLCGDPQINVALVRNVEAASAAGSIFLAAFKLPPEYLDRGQYPLRHFAEVMLPGSSGSSGSSSGLTAISLGGRPAYRVVLSKPNAKEATEAGYLTESNGYMILLVCTAESASELADLQLAIENLQFKDSPAQQP